MAEDKNKLSVEIEAKIAGLEKGLDDAKKELDKFNGVVEDSADKTGKLGDKSDKAGDQIKKGLSKESKKATSNLKDTANATKDVVEGLKDLADGKTSSIGKTVGAFEAFAATTTGTIAILGGIALAIAGVGFALQKYGEYRRDLVDERAIWARLRTGIDEYKASLFGLRKVQVAGAGDAAKQVATLKILKDRIDDTSASIDDRKKSIEDLRGQFPDYFKGMTDEEILVGNLGGKYDSLTNSLINNAKARAALERIVELEKDKLTLREQQLDNSQKYLDEQVKIDNALAAQAVKGGEISGFQGATARGVTEEVAARERQLDVLEDNAKVLDDISTIEERQTQLLDMIGDADLFSGKAKDEAGKLKKELKDISQIFASFGSQMQNPLDPPVNPLGEGSEPPVFEGSNAYQKQIENIEKFRNYLAEASPEIQEQMLSIVPDASAITEKQLLALEALIAGDQALLAQREAFKDNMNAILEQGVEQGIFNVADALGQAFATGENMVLAGGQALLGSIGSVLQQFGGLIVAAGFASEAFSKMMANPFGGGIAAIAAGAALIAIGGAVKAFAGSLGGGGSSKGGGGRGNYSGSSAGQGSVSYGGSSASQGGFSGSGSGGTVVFEIAGTKLIGVLNNTASRNRALGGSLGIAG